MVALHTKNSTGLTLHQSLKTKARQSGRTFEEIVAAQGIPQPTAIVPNGYRSPLLHFFKMTARRGESFMGGALRLSFEKMEAYKRWHGIELDPWEAKAIVAIDDAWYEQNAIERAK